MSIKTELDRLEGLRDDIGAAIREKGGTVPEGAKLADMPEGVRSITGGGGKRTARFVVGTSTAGWTAADCDYLCDGTDDQVEINAAIQALPAGGGEVRILDGTYMVASPIDIRQPCVKLSGNGASTVIKASGRQMETLIGILSDLCVVSDLMCDGVDGKTAPMYGVICSGSNTVITGIICTNIRESGIYIVKDNNDIINNVCRADANGIEAKGKGNSISGNICTNNQVYGIKISGGKNTAANNVCQGNARSGIDLNKTANNTIIGNICNDNSSSGIDGFQCSSSLIIGNVCFRGGGLPGDYTGSQGTISMSPTFGVGGENNLVIGNNCAGKAPVINGTGNIIQNNIVTA